MRLHNVFGVAAVAALVAADFGLANWNLNDVKQFLKDRKIQFDEAISGNDLTELANSEFEKLRNYDRVNVDVNDKDKQKILKLATDPHSSINDVLPHHNWDYLFQGEEKGQKVKDWIFDSWSTNSLKVFLKANKAKFDKHTSKQELIDLAKEKYDQVAKKADVSGNYPGDWLYSGWEVKDLQNWLTSFELPFDISDAKDKLLDAVKEHNFVASLTSSDSKKSLLDSLNLFDKPIFDKKGHIKSEFYDTWTYSQLREWLYSNGLIEAKPGVYSEELSIDKLKKLARDNEKYLTSDIKSWLEEAKKTANPLLSKATDAAGKAKESYDNIINNTFLVGIDKWSKDRLREFLKVRDVKASQFLTKPQLIELVKKNKDTPVLPKEASHSYSWLVENLSTESLREWLNERGQNIEGTRDDLVKGISNFLTTASEPSKNSIKNQIKNYKPNFAQYKKWVQKHYKDNKKDAKALSDDAIESTYKVANQYFDSASENLGSKYKDAKYSVDDALNEVQKASYEYSLDFLGNFEKNKDKLTEHLESAKIAAGDFSQNIGERFVLNYKESKSFIEDFIDSIWAHLVHLYNTAQSLIFNKKPVVEQYASGVLDAGATYASQAGEAGGEFAAQAKEHAQNAYEAGTVYASQAGEYASQANEGAQSAYAEGVKYASQAGDTAQSAYDKAAEQYQSASPVVKSKISEVSKGASSAYNEYEPVVKSRASEASASAQSAYKEYKPVVEKNAASAYEAAKDFSSKAGETAQKTYDEAKPVVESAWQYVVDTYNNADLTSYLQSFGFDHSWLSDLNRYELVKLANEQSKLFYGSPKTKWDKSILEVLKDSSDDLQKALHIKNDPPTLWQRIKSIL